MTISRSSAIASCLSSECPAVATSDGVTTVIDGIAHLALCESSSYLDPRSGRINYDVLRHLTNFLSETKDIKALPPAALVEAINCKRIDLSELVTKPEDLVTWLKSLGESKNHLKCLDLGPIPPSDEIIRLLPPSLEELRVFYCSDDTLLTLSTRLVNLKKLGLFLSENITGCHFDKLPEGLQELNCFSCKLTDDAIAKLNSRCSQLAKLNIRLNPAITSITGRFFDQLPEELQDLDCPSCALTDDAIAKLSKRCPQLKKLNIIFNSDVTGIFFDQLPEGLQELNCYSCNLTDDAIAKLISRCSQLTKLKIGFNTAVTGRFFDKLPEGLQELDYSGCPITDDAVAQLVVRCPNLLNSDLHYQ